ncbi:hypothetical protein MtrunA17_Chr4g0012401 [Medicago truncatula]|uniref:Uncharacterized protein n=1 Tax=Medicago truncatula TaxID=3880 RepID=A0A396I566_MEDTR|nr:hypothetical protein MtrunA17_Chr4g0012401 [Medicago truncatula]
MRAHKSKSFCTFFVTGISWCRIEPARAGATFMSVSSWRVVCAISIGLDCACVECSKAITSKEEC